MTSDVTTQNKDELEILGTNASKTDFQTLRKDIKTSRYGWKTFLNVSFMDKFKVPPRTYQVIQTNRQIVKLIDELLSRNCTLNAEHSFVFQNCVAGIDSHFDDSNSKIVVCTNNIDNEDHLQRLLGELYFIGLFVSSQM